MLLICLLDCLRTEMTNDAEKLGVSCSLPWIESMKGVLNYSEDVSPTCNTIDDYNDIHDFGYNFSVQASAQSHPKCLGT